MNDKIESKTMGKHHLFYVKPYYRMYCDKELIRRVKEILSKPYMREFVGRYKPYKFDENDHEDYPARLDGWSVKLKFSIDDITLSRIMSENSDLFSGFSFSVENKGIYLWLSSKFQF